MPLAVGPGVGDGRVVHGHVLRAAACPPGRRRPGPGACRSFSSASDRRVYTGSAKAGSWRSASKGSHSPARHAARSASKRPAPVGVHSASGRRHARRLRTASAYLRRASPAIRRSEALPSRRSSSAKASALITRSAVSALRPRVAQAVFARDTPRVRMASATTSNDPRSPAFHAPQATASSDETPTRPTSSARRDALGTWPGRCAPR